MSSVADAGVEMTGRDVEEARAGAAAQVLVAAAHREVDAERSDVDREHAERVIDVEQHPRAGRVRAGDDGRQLRHDLPGLEHHLRDDDEVGAGHDRGDDVVGREVAVVARLDERERDAPAARVLAQDHVERIELAAGGDDARRRDRTC